MKYSICVLKEKTKKELNTEFMYSLATARVDAVEILMLDLSPCEDPKGNTKALSSVTKMIRQQITKGNIEFFVSKEGLNKAIPEAFYLKNKFPEISGIVDTLTEDAVILKLKPLSIK